LNSESIDGVRNSKMVKRSINVASLKGDFPLKGLMEIFILLN
tara:strand:- start:125 stop:250 length:126 start_codon:yes stop_codon:yes gene_type:complete